MKKSVSMYGRVTPQKKTEAKPTGRPAQKGSAGQGNGVGSITPSAAAKDRRSPVVTDQTIATNSVIQAANDPKIKELVIKQQMMDRKQRESMEKKRPRGDLLTGAFLSLEHSGGFASSGHHSSHSGQFFYKHSSFDETSPAAGDHHFEGDRGFVRYPPSSPEVHHPSYAPHVGATPGSFTETVVQTDSGSAQLDDVNSELTADAGKKFYVAKFCRIIVHMSYSHFPLLRSLLLLQKSPINQVTCRCRSAPQRLSPVWREFPVRG